jgi:hypothetical protein
MPKEIPELLCDKLLAGTLDEEVRDQTSRTLDEIRRNN